MRTRIFPGRDRGERDHFADGGVITIGKEFQTAVGRIKGHLPKKDLPAEVVEVDPYKREFSGKLAGHSDHFLIIFGFVHLFFDIADAVVPDGHFVPIYIVIGPAMALSPVDIDM